MAVPAYYSLSQKGSSGPDVALIQTWLNGIRDACTWYGTLTVDGRFGDRTVDAVREFQLKNKLTMDGKVGRATWDALAAKYAVSHGTDVPYPGIVVSSGSSGAIVQYIQQQLNVAGERLTTDGKFGANTVAAVRRFQTRAGIPADGAVGALTWDKLFYRKARN